MAPLRCRCDGRYLGCQHGNQCAEEGGGYKSPYFCHDCDVRRIEYLTVKFDRLRATFSDPPTSGDTGV